MSSAHTFSRSRRWPPSPTRPGPWPPRNSIARTSPFVHYDRRVERIPSSLDGSQGDVLDENGRGVARFAIDDQRETLDDSVYAVFEDRDPGWEPHLRAVEPGHPARVSLAWLDSWRLDGVVVTDPEPPPKVESRPTGILMLDPPPDPLDGTMFRLEHPEL